MKTIMQGVAGVLGLILLSAFQSFGVVDQTIEVQGTNLVLSWPSQGYEYYMIQYWPDLATNSVQLTNCFPANSTNRTIFIIPCCTLAAFGGGESISGGSGSIDPGQATMMSNASESYDSNNNTELWVLHPDGTSLPLAIYPAGIDTNGWVIFEAAKSETQAESTEAQFSGQETSEALDFSNGGCDCPAMGFFRVWHVPDWAFNATNYIYDGPTFFPVDFKDYIDRVVDTQVLLDGQLTDYAAFMSQYYNNQTNWGMGIYFDRIPNGVHQIQLVSTIRLSDSSDDDAQFLILSNLTRSIVIDNQVAFTNWDDTVWNNTNYIFKAQTKTNETDWWIDIYDAYGDYVNGTSGHTTNGQIEWAWDLRDIYGSMRDNLDYDPFFNPYITFAVAGGGTNTTRYTPISALSYPSVGQWTIAYQNNFYAQGTESGDSMFNTMYAIQGWVNYRDVPASVVPIKFGTNGYTQADRDASWVALKNTLSQPARRNFYYFGHGNPKNIGGDVNTFDANGVSTGGAFLTNSKAFLLSKTVHDEITFNLNSGVHQYRFVWLDGCETALGDWPSAFGINKGTNAIGYYTNSVSNPSHQRPSAFVGWAVKAGGVGWGPVDDQFFFRSEWIKSWSYNWVTETLEQALGDAISTSNWPPGRETQLWNGLRVYGYTVLKMNEYNQKTDWSGL